MITRFQIREDVKALEEAMLGETFLRASDPSISVMTFLERVSSHLGAVKHAYARSANERSKLPDEIAPYVVAIRDACDALEAAMQNQDPPEDDNRSLESDRWGV